MIPLAQRLRERGVGNRIGFFLHVPMPSSDLLAALPAHREVFAALSSYDLVGFQTARDLERFQDYVRLFGGGRVIGQGELETAEGRRFRAGRVPDQHRHADDRAAGRAGVASACRCRRCSRAWPDASSRSASTASIIPRDCPNASARSNATSSGIRNSAGN